MKTAFRFSILLFVLLVCLAGKPVDDPTVFVSNMVRVKDQFVFNGTPNLICIEFPKATSFLDPNLGDEEFGGGLWVWNCPTLISIYVPKLNRCDNFVCGANAVERLDFPELVSIERFDANHNPSIVECRMPNLSSVGSWFIVEFSLLLTHLEFPLLQPSNGSHLGFRGNSLDQSSVDGILRRCVATETFVSGMVLLDQGNNSPPSDSGLIDKATLQARGVTVTTN